MNMHIPVRDDRRDGVLFAPEAARRAGAGPRSAAAQLVRFGFATLEAGQVTALGAISAAWTAAPVGTSQSLYLGVLTAALAAALRPRLAFGSGLAAIGSIGACTTLLLGQPGALLPWLCIWAAGSTAVSFGMTVVARRLPARLDPGALRVVLVEAQPWPGQEDGEPAARWHVLRRFSAHLPKEMEELRAVALSGSVDAVVLALPMDDATRIAEIQDLLADVPVRLRLLVDAPTRVPGLARAEPWLLDLSPDAQTGAAARAKRAMDIVLGGSALLLLLPLLLLIGLAIRLESPGPVLFRQWRFGLGGRPVRIFKFRTMRDDMADPTGEQRTTTRDPRVTPIGRILRRTSIDELPQLLNVLRGEMSLVGPRPHPLHMKVEGILYFNAVDGYRARHRVPPGITGWAQINGARGEVDTLDKARRRVELDLWYIRNWSLALDVKIIARTLLGRFATFDAD